MHLAKRFLRASKARHAHIDECPFEDNETPIEFDGFVETPLSNPPCPSPSNLLRIATEETWPGYSARGSQYETNVDSDMWHAPEVVQPPTLPECMGLDRCRTAEQWFEYSPVTQAVMVVQTAANENDSSPEHGLGCKPCFNHIKGKCKNGTECTYCHDSEHAILDIRSQNQTSKPLQAHHSELSANECSYFRRMFNSSE